MEINYYKTEYLNIDQLIPFQGDLKDLTEANYKKLKKQIVEKGFSMPFSVWENEKNVYILDGHQRHRVLIRMQKEGQEIPKVPCNFVKCASKQQAKELVLAFTSQYGELTENGLLNFIEESKTSLETLKSDFNLAGIDFRKLTNQFIENNQDFSKPDFPIAPIFSEKYDYVIIFCNNEIDRNNLFEILEIKHEKSFKGSKIGLGRAITYAKFKEIIDEWKK